MSKQVDAEETTGVNPEDLNCKQLFAAKMQDYSFPATDKELLARLKQSREGHTSTFKAYMSWAKRKRNPFPFRLVRKGDKYELEDKDPDDV